VKTREAVQTSKEPDQLSVSPEVWAAATFATARLPDARLNVRLVKVAATLGAKPLDSFPQACGDWAEAKGAYRFVENERVTAEAMIEAAGDATARASAGRAVVYSVQDTTTLSFPRAGQTEGLGPIGSCDVAGMLVHSTLALDEEGVAQGLFDQQWWCRPEEGEAAPKRRKETYKTLPLEAKESYKWFRGVEAAEQALARNVPATERPRLIHIFDSEGDIHELFERIAGSGDGAVIRLAQNRRVQKEESEFDSAHQVVRAAPLLATVPIDVPRKHGQAARTATVQVRACRVVLRPNMAWHRERCSLELGLVEVWEPNPPEDMEPLHWRLWTTEPATTASEALAVVAIYKKRWKIEDIHLTLKSGCRIEQVQFKTAARIAKVLALYSPVAVRLVRLRDLARVSGEVPCTEVLNRSEWQALWTYIHNQAPPAQTPVPTIRQAVLWIGRLGGHLGRKHDGMPGVRTLWRGWRDLQMLTTLYNASHR
jgi:hypothetical protein